LNNARRILIAGVTGVVILGMTACGSTKSGDKASGNNKGKKEGKIALLLPENVTARYEAADKPYFEKRLKQLCPKCTLDYQNAKSNEQDQVSQAEAAITNGANVLAIDALNGDVGSTIVQKAKAKGIPVLSYERLIPNADIDAYVSFDNEKVGEKQGQTLVDKLKADGTISKGKIIELDGDLDGDANARDFQKGAKKIFAANNVQIGAQYNTHWKPAEAQDEMDQAITAVGKANIIGVYAANDPVGGSAITSLTKAGLDPTKIPVTGQDAESAAVQRIIKGTQYTTVFKPIKTEGAVGAEMAYALLQGKKPNTNATANNGKKDVPARLLETSAVTQKGDNGTMKVADMFKDWWFTPAQVCTGEFAAPCATLGIK